MVWSSAGTTKFCDIYGSLLMKGNFDLNGREFEYEVISAEDEVGDDVDIVTIDEHLHSLDRIVYSVTYDNGEVTYRTVYGPFESAEQIEEAIESETDEYG